MTGERLIVQARTELLIIAKKIGTLVIVTGVMVQENWKGPYNTIMAHRWRLVTVGRPKDSAIVHAIDEYRRRLEPWQPLDWEVTAEIGYRPGQENEVLEREARTLFKHIASPDFVILLDIAGEQLTSWDFSRRMQRYQEQGARLSFVTGGSLGVAQRVRERADWRWSLSVLTLPHALAQLVAVEQIYRAFSILHHHPYHKA